MRPQRTPPAPQYDAIGDTYTRVKAYNVPDSYCFYPRFYETIGDLNGKTVLDIATGNGKVARELKARFPRARFVGIDQSQKMLDLAKSMSPGILFRKGTFGELGRVSEFEKFDRITVGWGLHYAKEEGELGRMCKDIAANLKPDGVCVALNQNPECPGGGHTKYGYYIYSTRVPPINGDTLTVKCFGGGETVEFYIRHFTRRAYRDAISAAGLRLQVIIPQPTEEGLQKMGAAWWREYLTRPTTAIFIIRHKTR